MNDVVTNDGNAASVVSQVCNTFKVYKADEPIHLVGTSVIHNLLQQTNDVIPPIILEKLVGTAMRTMSDFPNDMSIQQSACGILVTLCEDEHGKHLVKRELMISGKANVIILGLMSEIEGTVLQSAMLLTELLAHNASAVKCFCEETDAFSNFIGCMRQHKDSSKLQLQCCVILQQAGKASESLVYQMVSDEGLKAITYALERHSGLAELVEPACWVLREIIDVASSSFIYMNLLWEHRRLVGAAAISCMQKSLANTNAARAIVDVWLDMCSKMDYLNFELVKSVPLLLKAMQANLHDMSLQTRACSIITELCDFGEGVKLSRMGVVDSVRDALLVHRSSVGLVRKGFAALEKLISSEVASIMLDLSEFIVRLACIHLGDHQIQIHALAMATLDHSTVLKVLKDDVLKWVVQAMIKHEPNELVQKSACLALESYLVDPISRKKIEENKYIRHQLLKGRLTFQIQPGGQ